MDYKETHKGVTIAFTDIDTALMKLLGVTDTALYALHLEGDNYLNVYKLRFDNEVYWVTYSEYKGNEPLVTTTEEVMQFLFEAELST